MKKLMFLYLVSVFAVVQAVSANASALSDLAASMTPGTWAKLNTNGFDGGKLLYTTAQTRKIVDYAESGAWDPVSRQFLFLGAPHNNGWKFIIYRETDNTWREGPLPIPCMALSRADGGCGGHAFDLNTINTATGEFIWRYRSTTGSKIYKFNIANETWSEFPPLPDNLLSSWTQTRNSLGSLEYFPSRNGLFSIVSGLIFFYDANTMQWSKLPGELSMGRYHNFGEYNPIHNVMLFGGGNWSTATSPSREIYKMDSSGVVTKLNDAPMPMRITGSTGEDIRATLVTVDPVSGKYLVLTDQNNFYEYDIMADSWKLITNSAPINSHSIAAPISNYGVVMYVDRWTVRLYKHNTCASCPAPPVLPNAPTDFSVQ